MTIDVTYPITFTSGPVAITAHSDFRPEARWERENRDLEFVLGLDIEFEAFQQRVGLRIRDRDVMWQKRLEGDRTKVEPVAVRAEPYTLKAAPGRAVWGLISLREARTANRVRLSLSAAYGPMQRLVLMHCRNDGPDLMVEPVLWEPLGPNTYRYDRYGNRLWWEEVERFDSVRLADLDAVWRLYAEHVRLKALDAIPELVDHVRFGRWFREGNAAVDAEWEPMWD